MPLWNQAIELAVAREGLRQAPGHALLRAQRGHLVLHERGDKLEDAMIKWYEDLLRLDELHQYILMLIFLLLIVRLEVTPGSEQRGDCFFDRFKLSFEVD